MLNIEFMYFIASVERDRNEKNEKDFDDNVHDRTHFLVAENDKTGTEQMSVKNVTTSKIKNALN